MRVTDFQAGWAVLGNDGRRVGVVASVGQNYIRVSRPGMSADLHVPVSAIGNVESEKIHLNVTQPDAQLMGWEQEPREEDLGYDPESALHRHI
jgi:hypothetical protein